MNLGTENPPPSVSRRSFIAVTAVGFLLILMLAGALAVVVLSPSTVGLDPVAVKTSKSPTKETPGESFDRMQEQLGGEVSEGSVGQSDLDDLSSSVDDLTSQLSDVSGQVEDLDSRLSDAESNADDATSRVDDACSQLLMMEDGVGC